VAHLSEERTSVFSTRVTGYAVCRPRKSAKWSGTPKSVMLTCPSAEARTLRVRRSAHESRKCARCARERIEGEGAERLWLDGSNACFTSMC
jgi:hypothetical protein